MATAEHALCADTAALLLLHRNWLRADCAFAFVWIITDVWRVDDGHLRESDRLVDVVVIVLRKELSAEELFLGGNAKAAVHKQSVHSPLK